MILSLIDDPLLVAYVRQNEAVCLLVTRLVRSLTLESNCCEASPSRMGMAVPRAIASLTDKVLMQR